MRILHVTREVASDRRFGIGRSLSPVVEALQAAGHIVRYLTQEDQGPRAREWQRRWTLRLAPLAQRWLGPAGGTLAAIWIERLNMGRLAAKVVANSPVDVVHLHDPWTAWGFRLARLVHRGAPCRWGLTEHGFGAYTDAIREEGVPFSARLLRLHRRLEARILRAAQWVICPSAAAVAQLARDLGLPAAPAHWHGVPHARPQLALPARDAARAALGWAGEACQVLAVGRLNPVKRFEALVQACLRLQRPVRLTILGEGDPAPLQRLVDEAAAPQLALQVAVVDDVAPYLSGADLYVSTALNESFGMANLEALVAGLPAICTAVGSVPEVTGGRAWLVPGSGPGWIDDLAAAIGELIDDPRRRQAMGQAAARHAAAWPDAAAIGQRYEAIYQGLA